VSAKQMDPWRFMINIHIRYSLVWQILPPGLMRFMGRFSATLRQTETSMTSLSSPV